MDTFRRLGLHLRAVSNRVRSGNGLPVDDGLNPLKMLVYFTKLIKYKIIKFITSFVKKAITQIEHLKLAGIKCFIST